MIALKPNFQGQSGCPGSARAGGGGTLIPVVRRLMKWMAALGSIPANPYLVDRQDIQSASFESVFGHKQPFNTSPLWPFKGLLHSETCLMIYVNYSA